MGQDKKLQVSIARYKYVPSWHGFVIDDSFFYISICTWGTDGLTGAWNRYILIDAHQNDFGRKVATAFNGWFDTAFNKSFFSSGPEVFPSSQSNSDPAMRCSAAGNLSAHLFITSLL